MVGQSQCLKFKDDVDHWKYKNLDLSPILFKETIGADQGLYKTKDQDHLMGEILDWKFVEAAQNAIKTGEKVYAEFPIININRSVGTVLSHEVTKVHKGEGLPDGTIHFKMTRNNFV